MHNVAVREWVLTLHKLNKEAQFNSRQQLKTNLAENTSRHQTNKYISACKTEFLLISKNTWVNKCDHIYLRHLKRSIKTKIYAGIITERSQVFKEVSVQAYTIRKSLLDSASPFIFQFTFLHDLA